MSLTISQIVKNLVDVNDIKHDRQYSRVAKLHKYWSRKPWFVVDQYIEKYSKKDHVVLDPFCGSGIIGLQSVLADRNFIGYDLNPFAVFLAKNSMDVSYDQVSFENEFSAIEQAVREKIMPLYTTKDKYILYTILGKKNSKDYNAVIADSSFRNKQKVSLTQNDLEPTVKFPKTLKYPDMDFPEKFYKDRFSYKGVKKVSDMFTKRNLFALATLHTALKELPLKNRDLFMLAFTNTLLHVSKLKAENVRPLGVNNFWIPDDFIEENVWWRFVDRVDNVKMAKVVISEKASRNKVSKPSSKIYNKSSLKMTEIKPSSVDYLITDPPYGDTIQYSELSYIWNCWLEKAFEIEDEVIINPVQKKGVNEYYDQLTAFIGEAKRVLKKDAYFTLAFHNKDLKIWISLAELIRDHGMELVDISSYDTFGSPYNKNWAKFSPKSDFYVTFVNSQKKAPATNKKAIYPDEIANEIVKCLGKNNGKLFNLNKAYDLFVGVVISKIFDGSQVTEHERLSIENITNLFQDVPREEKRESKKKRFSKVYLNYNTYNFMEIYTKDFFNIFKANFDFEIVETEMGPAVKMPAKEAFIYSSITGAGYFENPIYPFTPKGLMKLFYNAFNYKFVSGIFDNGVLKNTPYILSQAKKYLFEGDKYIVPIEFESEEKLVDLLKEKFDHIKDRENYIIQRIETSKQGNGMEPFMEYLAGEYFRHLGFIVENQIPLAHAIGSPDFAGYGLSELITKISKYGYLPSTGFHMIELALIRNFKQGTKDESDHVTHDFIVGEAKTGNLVMTKQLEKYLNTGLFDQGFEIHPAKAKPSKDYFGLISLDADFKIKITLPETKYTAENPLSREEYTVWLGNYIKFYLISNLTNDELKQFYLESKGEEINKESDLVSFVLALETEAILEKIKSL